MSTTAPIGRSAMIVAFAASAALLVLAAVPDGSPVVALAAIVPAAIVAATLSGRERLREVGVFRLSSGSVAVAAAVSIVVGGGTWVAPLLAVVPLGALAAAAGARSVALVLPVPAAAAALVITSGTERVEVVAAAAAAAVGADVVQRAGRWLVDGAQEQRRRLSELGNLLRAADVLAALDDDDRAAATISALCRELVDADAVALFVRSDVGGTTVASRDDEDLLPPASDHALEGLVARAIARNSPTIHEAPDPHAAVGVRWFMVVPLLGTTASMGAVVLAFSSEMPDEAVGAELTGIGERFAHQAGLTLERIRSLQRVAAAALRDPLTGVGNRRALESVLAQLRPGDAVALFDLDHFKGINDQFGHSEGDKVLVAFAGHLRRSTPHDSVVGRWGGEEFIVVFRAAHHRAGILVEEVRAGWEVAAVRTTCSAGVSLWHRGHDLDEFIDEADQALYAAKNGGRNRVMSWDGDGFVSETPDAAPVDTPEAADTDPTQLTQHR